MLRFFRNIRSALVTRPESKEPKLLENNRLRLYIMYAIGEVLLVMIGILLALQVNNWNEKRKSNIHERKLLTEYQDELKYNMEAVSTFRQDILDRANCCKVLLDAIEQNKPYKDSYSSCYYVLTRGIGNHLSYTVFHALESQGIDLLSFDDLKDNILDLHTFQYGRLSNRIENQVSNIREYGRPILRHRLKAMGNHTYVPVNYDKLMSDVSLWNILRTLHGNYNEIVNHVDETAIKMKELDAQINKYLK